MNQRIPKPIQPLLEDYLCLMSQHLPSFMNACYIVGSIALDEFNEHFSDIDFVAVVDHRTTQGELEGLRHVHQVLEHHHPRWKSKMSGMYLQSQDLGHFDADVKPYPSCHDGVLRPHGPHELNSITWWILKNHGIALTGPDPRALPFSVDWDLLIAKTRENLNSYWASWTAQPKRIIMLLSNWGVQWAILGVLRQYYTFHENKITTKRRAGEYALSLVPARWHRLIQEALNLRANSRRSLYRSRIIRAIDAVRFLQFIIQSCNTYLEKTTLR